ncbi:hypothetical protein M885DRAFT_521811 [Pelagophyceae sp. CCMP2097]|nr:hypothetical protein M885DRAFT_521811 [Pelagophyceae sp. CCMP2097]
MATTAEVLGEALATAQGLGGGAALWWDESTSTQKIYVDRQFFASFEEQVEALRGSKTVYLGNLSFYTTEAQIYELCARCGPVKRVRMGLNRHAKTPCGFAFVEHFTAEAALENVARVTGLMLDDRVLRSELDFGFREGRQFGRGASGGQVRDDRRLVYDAGRESQPDNSITAAPGDEGKAAERKKRFAIRAAERAEDDDDDDEKKPAGEAAPQAGNKRRRRDDDDDDDAGSDDE